MFFAGAATALVAGVTGMLRVRRRDQTLASRLWLRFWNSAPGGWAARFAGLGLESPHRRASWAGDAFDARAEAWQEVPKVVYLVNTQIQRIQAWVDGQATSEPRAGEDGDVQRRLTGGLRSLEALRARFEDVDHASAVSGGLSADLDAARKVCEMVEGLLGARLAARDVGGRGAGAGELRGASVGLRRPG